MKQRNQPVPGEKLSSPKVANVVTVTRPLDIIQQENNKTDEKLPPRPANFIEINF